jgi:LCP family protein required for cell wall assembly
MGMVRGMALKAVFAVCCVVAGSTLVVSGYARYYLNEATSIGASNAIASGPLAGEQNILLMGLESRTDYDGNILPADLLAAMHAGSVRGVQNGLGGQATNTLILIHTFDGGSKAVGFSIPRDDWVTFPSPYGGQSAGKIDQAYGLAWAQSLSQTSGSGLSKNEQYLLANEAGQRAAIDTVDALTGVRIEHFAEVNLAGFYELAKVFGGIQVCLKEATSDSNSGANFRPGYQHLWAAQALAFVRQRDNLLNGDLDRTHRQQAVIDYVLWKLEHEGVLSDIGQLNSLLSVARQYVITEKGWNLLTIATQMRSLTGRDLIFHTLPVAGYRTYFAGGRRQAANVIDPTAIRSLVQRTFYPPATAGQGAAGGPAGPVGAATASVSPSASGTAAPGTASPSDNGGAGGAVTVSPDAPYGIPCVY